MTKEAALIICMVIAVSGCRNNSKQEGEELVSADSRIDSACTMYIMYSPTATGNYMFKVSSSGACQSLTKEVFLKEYNMLLKEHRDDITLKTGKIVFDYYSFKQDSIFIDELIRITDFHFKTKSAVTENSEERIVIETEN
ncbi:MAG: hypothetical protein AB7G44_16845 [Bacteroidia bacterium]